jgi:hypothetical protein
MRARLTLALALILLSRGAQSVDAPPPILRIPGAADVSVTVENLRKAGTHEIPVTSEKGESVTYKGVPLLDVLEGGGLEIKTMAADRRLAPAIVVATARDGYTVAFSVGELAMHRSDPRVFLAGETTGGALPTDQGPVRLVVTGQRARSVFALAQIEVRILA